MSDPDRRICITPGGKRRPGTERSTIYAVKTGEDTEDYVERRRFGTYLRAILDGSAVTVGEVSADVERVDQ